MTTRKHNPAWRDGTRNERQRRRQAALDEAAQAAGFETWSRLDPQWSTAPTSGSTHRQSRQPNSPATPATPAGVVFGTQSTD